MVDSTISLDELILGPPGEPSHGGCGSCGSGQARGEKVRCGNGLEKIYPTTAVRFGYMRYIGEFSHTPDMKFSCGAKVVIQTKRGIEMGDQVSLTCSGCDKSVTREQMRKWVKSCGQESFIFEAGRILREATAADLAEYAHIQEGNRKRRDFSRLLARRRSLPMHMAESESLFGGERIIFYFTSEERVDFRDLVKELAQEYRTRIEMRQIGARDEARLLADYETCGREVCCKVFLKTLRPISMRMAKLQKATLDPSQVSGRCGRLKCCLRYEHVGYEELDKLLPRTGVRIRTQQGEGVVVNRQILTQLVQIRADDDTLMTVVAEDIMEVDVPATQRSEPAGSDVAAKGTAEARKSDPRRDRSRGRGRQGRPTETGSASSPRTAAPTGSPAGQPRADRGRGGNRPGSSEGTGQATKDGTAGREPRGRSRRRRRRRPPSGSSEGGSAPKST